MRSIAFPRFRNAEGFLVPVEFSVLPFEPKRLFYIKNVPYGAVRGNHAHKEGHQIIISVVGEFLLQAEQYSNCGSPEYYETLLNASDERIQNAFYAPPKTWLVLSAFSEGSVCLVLSSHTYDPEDYINERSEFKRLCHSV